MKFEADIDFRSGLGSPSRKPSPVVGDLVPLPVPEALHVRQPRPAREDRPGASTGCAWAAAHRDHSRCAEQPGELDRASKICIVLLPDAFVRVKWIARNV